IAATNDDGCNCDKSQDFLISPPLDFKGLSGIALQVDIFFAMGTYESSTEQGTVEISLDGDNWTVLEELHGHGGWDTHKINLSAYAGLDSVYVAFHYNDNGGWVFGFAIDNIIFEVPLASDAALINLKSLPYGEENKDIAIAGAVLNNGLNPITSLEFVYTINGGDSTPVILDGLDIQPFTSFEFVHPVLWTPASSGLFDVKVEIVAVNMAIDDDSTNNSLSYQTEIFPHISPPNKIDEFLNTEPVFTTIASAADGLDKPNDLDFFPILAKNELWVVNERVENTGGNTVTIYDAATPQQTMLNRTDGNAWHFMSMPTGIAFSDNFNFATSPGVKDANHNNGTFTGPALWSSDPDIYAQPSGGNGSHLDMLHGSPFSMGIASESDNVFWVFDGWNETIVRYDFNGDHGPGNDDHADAIVRRYTEIQVKKDGIVPSHLVLDKTTNWLYVVDNGNNRVVRLDIQSGNVINSLPLINEPLAEHSEMGNVIWEVVADSLNRPCGIEIFENRLLVGDFTTGQIIIYDLDNAFLELGRIETGQPGLTGIKIGPDGAIWYTNRLQNTLTKLEPGDPTSTFENRLASQVKVMPNPTSGNLIVEIPQVDGTNGTKLELRDVTGKHLMSIQNMETVQSLNLENYPDGIYFLSVSNEAYFTTIKVVLKE
ncbi:MAG: T9SS type A sorting domain-containing protein, partial [Bacteroidota bacterium]|nr:T9SS type A sorting domain-containing protein [Bacteroidota bacterium]